MLGNVHPVSTVLQVNFNAGVSTSDEKGFFGLCDLWLNEQVIANLLSITQLEKDGYGIDHNTNRDLVVTTPEEKTLLSKKDVGMCEEIPYLDICGNHDAFVMIQTVRKKFGMFKAKQLEKAIELRDMQARMSHPTNDNFKLLVRIKSLDTCSVVASDITKSRTLFVPNHPGLRGEIV